MFSCDRQTVLSCNCVFFSHSIPTSSSILCFFVVPDVSHKFFYREKLSRCLVGPRTKISEQNFYLNFLYPLLLSDV